MKASFQNIPYTCKLMINQIQDKVIQNLYSKYEFLYLSCSFNNELKVNNECDAENQKSQYIINYLLEYLHDFKFITYRINTSDITENPVSKNCIDPSAQKVNTIICIESKCLLIEEIELELIIKIINQLKSLNISVLDTNLRFNGIIKAVNERPNPIENYEEEVFNFCIAFRQEIIKNIFVQTTILPMACYHIRRYFYPTSYFKDPSFFVFDQHKNESTEGEIKRKIIEFFQLKNDKRDQISSQKLLDLIYKKSNLNNEQNHIQQFDKNDFIELRTIISDSKSICILGLHTKSLHLFLVKKFVSSKQNEKPMQREIDFCQHFSNRCMTHFYGFLLNKSGTIGLVYEYMCNSTLDIFTSKSKDKVYSLMSIIRIFQAIEYLHSQKLIFRDLKPNNVFIDHDFLPHLTDYETIRFIIEGSGNEEDDDDDDKTSGMTNDIGSISFSSPEQLKSKKTSYPTDIYSFGLVIYFLFEKRILELNSSVDLSKQMPNTSKNLQNIVNSCIEQSPKNRPNHKTIKDALINEVISLFNDDQDYLYELIKQNKKSEIIQLLFECLIITQNEDKNKINKLLQSSFHIITDKDNKIIPNKIALTTTTNKNNINNSDALLFIGNLYENGYGVKQNYLKAKEYYELSAQQKNSNALIFIGNLYLYGKGVEKDILEAFKYYEQSASENNLFATTFLSNAYYYGYYVKQDYLKAKIYNEQLSKQNISNANFHLGTLYENGYGVDKNYMKAKEYYELEAAKNNSYALLKLGNFYFNGYGVDRDASIAIKYYELSSELGNPIATLILGDLYFNGCSVDKDYTKAKEYYELLTDQNNPKANFKLGLLYDKGYGVVQDYSKAKEFYELASKQNNQLANLFLGNFYYNGLGVKQDYLQAKAFYSFALQTDDFEVFNKFINFYNNFDKFDQFLITMNDFCDLSIYQNNQYDHAIVEIIYFCFNFNEFDTDFAKAKQFYEILARQNNPNAILKLASFYEDGIGVKKDYKKAKEYYEQLAKQNNQAAILKLASFYENGYGVEKSYFKAKELYEKLAKKNNQDAILNLGCFYENGFGVEKDYIKAKEYYEKIALQYNSEGLYKLGELYYNGKGVKKDIKTAILYFKLSAQLHNSKALYKLGVIWSDGDYEEEKPNEDKNKEEKNKEEKNKEKRNKDDENEEEEENKDEENKDEEEEENEEDKNEEDEIEEDDIDDIVNYSNGKKYFQLSAQLNNTDAYCEIGNYYFEGNSSYPKNPLLSIIYFEYAAKQNNIEICNALGDIFYSGEEVKADIFKAIHYFKLAADKGDLDSIKQLADIYFSGLDIKTNYSKARHYYELAGKQGDIDSIKKLGDIYFNGYGVKQNYKKAIEYYQIAAEKGDICTIIKIGDLYFNGNGVKQSIEKAIGYYNIAIEKGDMGTIIKMGNLYFDGNGVAKDVDKAIKYYTIAGKKGNHYALLKLGNIYYNGIGVEQNYLEAQKYFEILDSLNNADGIINLGHMYLNGNGVKKDYSEAKKYFEKACKLNAPVGFFNIGVLYYNGFGVKQDYSKAEEYFLIAGEKGYAIAYIMLGRYYYLNRKRPDLVLKYFKKAVDLKENCENELPSLGYIYEQGIGVPRDYIKAKTIYESAASQNNEDSFILIGNLYFYGNGVDKDYKEAQKWYEKACNEDSYSQFNLAYLYLNDYIEDQDYSNGKKYLEMSASGELSYAYLYLANLHYNGEKGFQKNHDEAISYYKKSAQLNNKEAYYFLGKIYSNDTNCTVDININKSIKYFKKCFNMFEKPEEPYDIYDGSLLLMHEITAYYYVSANDLGLIYLIYKNDIENAKTYLSASKCYEYPFGQNNYGLFSQFYSNNTGEAEFFYRKASKSKFALAEYNLGYLIEAIGTIDDAIPYYIDASSHEDEPLIFKKQKIEDNKLEISKTFIICLTNLKLVNYYFSKQCLEEAKEYFIRSLLKININDEKVRHKFSFCFNRDKTNDFKYLKKFILSFPLFNLSNQPNLKTKMKFLMDSEEDKKEDGNSRDDRDGKDDRNDKNDSFKKKLISEIQDYIEKIRLNDSMISSEKLLKFLNSCEASGFGKKEKKLKAKIIDLIKCSKDFNWNNENTVFENPGDFFDFATQNEELRSIFINEINDIISTMNEILYTYPYPILFGRIFTEKLKVEKTTEQQDINNDFKDGFEI